MAIDFSKLEKVSETFLTATEIGISAATLNAFARRGLVEVQESSPKRYRRINSPALKIYRLCEENKKFADTYFTLYKKGQKVGMLCSINKNTIVDCWGDAYDLTNTERVVFKNESYKL